MNVKGLLLDLDGTLYVGDEPLPGAAEAVGHIRTSGIAVRYVTNTTRRPRRVVRERLAALGFEVEEGEIFTPARAAAAVIGSRSCFPLVAGALLEDLADVVLTTSGPDVVLVGDLGPGFTYERLNAAFRHLMAGADLVALQKNRYWMKEDGLALDAGPFVAALEYASDTESLVVGKPEPAFFASALQEMGLRAQEVAMVGDDPETDVAGARTAGLAGIQVRTGKYRPGFAAGADLEIASVADLPGALGL